MMEGCPSRFNAAAGQCTRCGRVTALGNLCASCTSRLTSKCTACHIRLCVASDRQTAARVLCPPCQASASPRGNPYPVVLPTARSTVAYTYLPARVCMRFGCGTPLPAHLLGDVCEACARAGFAKRVARWTTEGTSSPRPREPPASSVRNAPEVEKENVRDELDVELVYPDDVPVETRLVSEPESESKSEEPEPTGDVDVELELVYPEDVRVEEATPTALSKPQTKSNPLTALRELFAKELQCMPGLQDLDRAKKTLPHRCQIPGCDKALPVQTCMERCVECIIGDWKRRKSAAADSSEHNSTIGLLTTDTPMEGEQVATLLDEISDVDDKGDTSLPISSPGESSSTGPSRGKHMPGWDSDLTELSSGSESESFSDSDPDPDPKPSQPHGDTTGFTIRVPLFIHQFPQDASSRRKCGNKRCNIALPKDHRWKTCDPCRRAQRAYQRIRLENQRRSILGVEALTPPNQLCRRWRSLSPDVRELETTLTPQTSRPCAVRRCPRRIPLLEVYRWKTCAVCRAKARRNARRKRDAVLAAQRASKEVPRFLTYQNRGALLSSFDSQLKGFVEGQIVYLRAKLRESEMNDRVASRELERVPTVFVFVGEYSIVTGQRRVSDGERDEGGGEDDDGRDRDCGDARLPSDSTSHEAMRREVSGVVSELESALRTTFSAGEAFATDEGGMIMRFTCALELIAQLRPLRAGSGPSALDSGLQACTRKDDRSGEDEDGKADHWQASAPRHDVTPSQQFLDAHPPDVVPLIKKFSGELEAVVIPDESHRLYHGRRTVIRYCMLG